MARAWYLKARPSGLPTLEDFELREVDAPAPAVGSVKVRNLWLSVDPYMRGRMNDVASYVAPFALSEPLDGAAIGEVVQSTVDGLAPGDLVSHRFGWRDEVTAEAGDFLKLDPRGLPPELFLNSLGMIGATAYFGLLRVGEAKAGQTLFVSAAAGAVGSTVVQIAKLKGLRVIASAGGAEKCALAKELGADVAIDYKAEGSLVDKLAAAAPEGIDVYFDNVGGEHLDAAMAVANQNARFAICGMIDMYNSSDPVSFKHLFRVISARIRIEGFIVSDFRDQMSSFHDDMAQWVADGRIVGRETVAVGLEQTPAAFLSLFSGQNTGKMLVRLDQ